jgi:hypothetical protein
LISKKENKNASFYWRYTTIEIEEKDLPNIDIHFGIILNSKTNNKDIVNLLKTKLTDQFFNILNDGYTSGTRSVIQKKYDRFTFNNNKLLAKIGIEKLNDLEINNWNLSEVGIFKDEILSFINDKNNKEFYETILEYLQENSN